MVEVTLLVVNFLLVFYVYMVLTVKMERIINLLEEEEEEEEEEGEEEEEWKQTQGSKVRTMHSKK